MYLTVGNDMKTTLNKIRAKKPYTILDAYGWKKLRAVKATLQKLANLSQQMGGEL